MLKSHPKILSIGTKHIPEHLRPEIEKAIVVMFEELKAAGVQNTSIFFDPEDGVDKIKERLVAEQYDGVLIGYGLRSIPELTVFFEQIVNTIVEVQPKAKLLFNSHPSNTLDAVKRWFS
jgi:hypothetical protein